MKNILVSILVTASIMLGSFLSHAQNPGAITIILLRHAEKDTVAKDPSLSAAGAIRANKLPGVLSSYHPDIFYSTNYKRTRQTLAPWAGVAGKEIVLYNPDELAAFAENLKKMNGKTIVVAGHSNTTPHLANRLLGKEKYTDLDDAVYNKIWVIKLQGASATDEVIEY